MLISFISVQVSLWCIVNSLVILQVGTSTAQPYWPALSLSLILCFKPTAEAQSVSLLQYACLASFGLLCSNTSLVVKTGRASQHGLRLTYFLQYPVSCFTWYSYIFFYFYILFFFLNINASSNGSVGLAVQRVQEQWPSTILLLLLLSSTSWLSWMADLGGSWSAHGSSCTSQPSQGQKGSRGHGTSPAEKGS